MLFNNKIYLDKCNFSNPSNKYLKKIINNNNLTKREHLVSIFEDKVKKIYNKPYALAVNSGTCAIYLALKFFNYKPDKRVTVPVLTFTGTVNAIKMAGLIPCYRDVDLTDFCCNNKYPIKNAISLPVDLYGASCSWKNDLAVLDACESFGNSTRAGIICLSFNGNKTITCAGGGMILSDNSLDEVRDYISNQKIPGFNYYMQNLNAAIGLDQLVNFPYFKARKIKYNEIYRDRLSGQVRFQSIPFGAIPWMTVVLLKTDNINEIITKLATKNIESRRVFKPLSDERGRFPNAWHIYNHGICLPSSTLNTNRQIKRVCRELIKIIT